MAQPVWTLSVDLQTKTATFQSGMADAAKAARGSFNDIKEGAREMGESTRGSMMEARHSVQMLGEEFGVHLPRGLTMFITSLGPVAAAMEAAFPFLAIAMAAKILMDHLGKTSEEAGKTAAAWKKVASVGAEAFDVMQSRLTQAEIKADELAGNHLGALELKLKEIDHATMREVISELDKMASAADTAFKGLEHGWFMRLLMGHADVGPAKQQLDDFISEIDKLKQANASPEAVSSLVKVDVAKVQADMSTIWNRMAALRKEEEEAREAGDSVSAQAAEIALQKAQEEWGFKQKELDVVSQMAKVSATGTAAANLDKKNDQMEEEKRSLINLIGLTGPYTAARLAMAKADEKLAEEQRRASDAFTEAMKKQEEEQAKLQEQAGKENGGHGSKMAELQLAADREAGQMRMAQKRMSAAELLDMELGFAAKEYDGKRDALNRELAALDTADKEYTNKKLALNNKLLELDKQFANQDQALEDQAQKKRLSSIQDGENRMKEAFAKGSTEVLMGKMGFAKMMQSLDSQIVSGMLENAIKSIMMNDMTKESDAAAAARKAFLAGMHFPFPANIVMGPTLGAMAFASVMAFETGGIVPGVGVGDIVPAMLTPGEAVLPKALTESLTNRAKFGDSGGGGDVHVHHHATYHINAIDASGVKGMLDQHGDQFVRHAANHLRKMNR